ncbi:DUF3549 family protein [Vibrio chagasii]|nr:DUF3549 family protein [Vibrio chagasii]
MLSKGNSHTHFRFKPAHLAISYWNEQKQPWIWFARSNWMNEPTQPSDVGSFLKFVLEAMGTRLSGEISEEQQKSCRTTHTPSAF